MRLAPLKISLLALAFASAAILPTNLQADDHRKEGSSRSRTASKETPASIEAKLVRELAKKNAEAAADRDAALREIGKASAAAQRLALLGSVTVIPTPEDLVIAEADQESAEAEAKLSWLSLSPTDRAAARAAYAAQEKARKAVAKAAEARLTKAERAALKAAQKAAEEIEDAAESEAEAEELAAFIALSVEERAAQKAARHAEEAARKAAWALLSRELLAATKDAYEAAEDAAEAEAAVAWAAANLL
jgi:hypothetical protein